MLRFSMKLSSSKLHVVYIDKGKDRKFRKGYKNFGNISEKNDKAVGCVAQTYFILFRSPGLILTI